MNSHKFEALDNVDPELYLAKIYESNMDKINNITKVIKVSQIIGIISFFIFLVLIALRVNSNITFSTFYIGFPAISSLVSFTITLNMYLKLKDIFDEAEKRRDEENGLHIGSILSYFSLNTVSILVLFYVIFSILKIEGIILTQWNLISVSLYIVYGIGSFYFIFILPAFLQNKLIIEIILILIYLISSLISIILINLKLDENNEISYVGAISPLLAALGIHLIYTTFGIIKFKEEIISRISFFISISLLFAGSFLIAFKQDHQDYSIKNWVGPVLFIISYMFFVSEIVYEFIFEEKDDEKSEKI